MVNKERVVLVHGTFASDPSDVGPQWWQKSGPLQRFLLERATDMVDAAEPVVFHWSGENSASARASAGADLLAVLLRLERHRETYHIVAHSHGGGVVFEALTDAIEHARRHGLEPLPGLVSWTTVGTPFVIAWPQRHWITSLRQPFRMLAALLLAAMNVTLILTLLTWPLLDLAHDLVALGLIALLLVTTSLSGRLSVSSYLMCRADARVAAMKRFGPRWLPVWSIGDEALNSLAVTVTRPSFQLLGRRTAPRTNPHAPIGSIVRWPAYYAMTLLLNALRPRLNRVVTASVMRGLQGYDYVYADVVSIGPGPLPPFSAYPSVPAHVDAEVTQGANAEAEAALTAVRTVLYSAAMMGADVTAVAAGLHERLSGRELVHTRYFEHESILSIIELHMRHRTRVGQPRPAAGDLHRWVVDATSAIETSIARVPQNASALLG